MEVTEIQKKQHTLFWAMQKDTVRNMVSEKTMRWFNIYTKKDNVGYKPGQLRPGELGQWDLYHWLTDPEIGCEKSEAIIASGLTPTKIQEEEIREYYRESGIDPDNTEEMRIFDRIVNMSSDELDLEIERLENLLHSLE